MTSPVHHPTDEQLLAYSAGAQQEAVAALLAAHLTLCPECRAACEVLDEAGGHWLSELPAEDAATGLPQALARLDAAAPPSAPALPEVVDPHLRAARVPWPILRYLPAGAVRWRALLPGVRTIELPLQIHGQPARLVHLPGGFHVPFHTHGGLELTLVLSGGLTDCGEHYQRGDLIRRDPSHRHDQVVDRGGSCVCFIVNEAPLQPLTVTGWLLQKLTGL